MTTLTSGPLEDIYARPVLEHRDIVFLSSMEWDQLWQGHHELASRLAANGNRVLYVENIGVRAPRWADRSRVVSRVGRWSRDLSRGGVRQVADRLWVSTPLLMPPFGGPGRTVNRRLLIEAVARSVRRIGMRDAIVWTYLPTDTARDLIARLRTPRSVVVYSCLAEFADLVSKGEALTRSEQALLAQADLVFALPGLVERCARHSDRVVPWTPAVSTERFDPSTNPPPPPSLRDLAGPVVGYVGGLHRHVDLELLARLADERPDWTWVLVGPAQVPVDALADRPNVRLPGPLPHTDLPGAIAAFDVGIVPYHVNAHTASIMPTKVGEYLAMGKPVVSTPIPTAMALEQTSDGEFVTAAATPAGFLTAIERAMALAGDERTVERCRAMAMTCSWSERLEEMSAALAASATMP